MPNIKSAEKRVKIIEKKTAENNAGKSPQVLQKESHPHTHTL